MESTMFDGRVLRLRRNTRWHLHTSFDSLFSRTALGILGKGGLFVTPPLQDCLTRLTGSSTLAGTGCVYLQLVGNSQALTWYWKYYMYHKLVPYTQESLMQSLPPVISNEVQKGVWLKKHTVYTSFQKAAVVTRYALLSLRWLPRMKVIWRWLLARADFAIFSNDLRTLFKIPTS